MQLPNSTLTKCRSVSVLQSRMDLLTTSAGLGSRFARKSSYSKTGCLSSCCRPIKLSSCARRDGRGRLSPHEPTYRRIDSDRSQPCFQVVKNIFDILDPPRDAHHAVGDADRFASLHSQAGVSHGGGM